MARTDSLRGLLTGVTAVATFVGVLFVPAGLLHAQASDLLISEYVEGSGNNQALEIYNPTSNLIGLSGYALEFYLDGGSGSSFIGFTPGATIAPGGTYVVANANATASLLAKAQLTADTTWFNGDDVVMLVHSGTAIDVIGQVGAANRPASGYWGAGDITTRDHTLRRKLTVASGDTNAMDAFDPTVEWDGFPVDTFAGLGWVGTSVNQPVAVSCPSSVETTQGIPGTADVSATDPDGSVTSLAVTSVTPGDPGTISVVAVTAASAAGGTATGTLSVSPSTPVGSYTVTVEAVNDDASPQSGTCDVTVTVSPPTIDSLHSLVGSMADAGDVAPAKAPLLQQRLDRIEAAVAAGRTADAAAQLRAFVNQVNGLSPRWVSAVAASLLAQRAAAVASSL
jgi:hypothetical protein